MTGGAAAKRKEWRMSFLCRGDDKVLGNEEVKRKMVFKPEAVFSEEKALVLALRTMEREHNEEEENLKKNQATELYLSFTRI